MRSYLEITFLVSMLLILCSCGAQSSNGNCSDVTIPTSSETTLTPIEEQNSPEFSDTDKDVELPVYFPDIGYRLFCEETQPYGGTDEFLYDCILSPLWFGTGSTDEHLYIPTLRIYDQWEDGDGTYYLCGITIHELWGVKEQLLKGTVVYSETRHTRNNDMVRFRIEKQSSYMSHGFFCITEVLQLPDKGDGGKSLLKLCAGRPIGELFMKDSSEEVPYLREVPAGFSGDCYLLLQRYLETYFPEVTLVK